MSGANSLELLCNSRTAGELTRVSAGTLTLPVEAVRAQLQLAEELRWRRYGLLVEQTAVTPWPRTARGHQLAVSSGGGGCGLLFLAAAFCFVRCRMRRRATRREHIRSTPLTKSGKRRPRDMLATDHQPLSHTCPVAHASPRVAAHAASRGARRGRRGRSEWP